MRKFVLSFSIKPKNNRMKKVTAREIYDLLLNEFKIKEEQTNITAHTNMKAHICITEFSNPKCAYKII